MDFNLEREMTGIGFQIIQAGACKERARLVAV